MATSKHVLKFYEFASVIFEANVTGKMYMPVFETFFMFLGDTPFYADSLVGTYSK